MAQVFGLSLVAPASIPTGTGHASRAPWDLVHQVGFCGYREPGYCWKIDAPFVWGPVGGTSDVPLVFLPSLGASGAMSELLRQFPNFVHLRFRRRVRQALRSARHVLAANSSGKRHIEAVHGRPVEKLLETGITSLPPRHDRGGREGPIRLLWSGRFCAWKGFPLLLRALQEIASDTSFELRVIAYGPLEQASKLLAKKLQLDNRITWLGWPPWESTFAHYDWADAFVFTSLRDTSGTGLLEAMAHGCPVIGLDHQGAHDIMSDDASIRIAVTNPRDVARQIAQAVSMLQRDVQLRQRLSTNSYRRAEEFLWSKQHSKMLNIYSSVIASARTHPVLHPSRTKYLCRTSA